MTTHRERIQACIKGEILDQTPVALWRHFPVDDQSPETLAAAQIAFQHAYDFDLVKVTPASSFCLRDWGAEDEWRGNPEGTRQYTKHVISQPQDWERLQALDPTAAASRGTISLSPSNPRGTRPKHADASNHLQPTITGEKSGRSEHTSSAFTKTSRGGNERAANHRGHNPTIRRSRA